MEIHKLDQESLEAIRQASKAMNRLAEALELDLLAEKSLTEEEDAPTDWKAFAEDFLSGDKQRMIKRLPAWMREGMGMDAGTEVGGTTHRPTRKTQVRDAVIELPEPLCDLGYPEAQAIDVILDNGGDWAAFIDFMQDRAQVKCENRSHEHYDKPLYFKHDVRKFLRDGSSEVVDRGVR